jgi:hypothetical protein
VRYDQKRQGWKRSLLKPWVKASSAETEIYGLFVGIIGSSNEKEQHELSDEWLLMIVTRVELMMVGQSKMLGCVEVLVMQRDRSTVK